MYCKFRCRAETRHEDPLQGVDHSGVCVVHDGLQWQHRIIVLSYVSIHIVRSDLSIVEPVRLCIVHTKTNPPGLVQVRAQQITGLSGPSIHRIYLVKTSLYYTDDTVLAQPINQACPPATAYTWLVTLFLGLWSPEGTKIRTCGGRRSHTPLLHRGSRRGSRLHGSVLALTMDQAVGDAVLLREDGLAVRALDV